MQDKISIEEIEILLSRKKVRNLSLRVLPTEGIVKATVPIGMDDVTVRKFLEAKQNWIRKQIARMADNDIEKPLEFISGEEHCLFGKKYQLLIKEGSAKQGVFLSNDVITLYCKAGSSRSDREEIMDKWYRINLLRNLPGLVKKWESIMGLVVKECRVRKMKTRWGTCNPKAARIWISLMLAKRRPELVEYIVVHEMVHLLERGHNKRFYNYMDRFLPDWKSLRKELK